MIRYHLAFSVVKKKPEKFRFAGIPTLTSVIPEQCSGIAEVRVGILASLNFFRLFFHNCKSCDFNHEDLLYIYFFIPLFKYTKFIYSYLGVML